jgi:hypothetical protein
VLREGLRDGYDLSGVDMRPVAGFDSLAADTTDRGAIQPPFEDVDVVVDLTSVPDQEGVWDVVYKNNLPSTFKSTYCRATA